MQAALREGIALALMNMRDSYVAAGKKGSLTCEDLVGSLSAIMCDFDTSLPFPAATELAAHDASVSAPSASSGAAAGGGGTAVPKVASSSGKKGDGMTPGQRVFYLKILKPRKPGRPLLAVALSYCVIAMPLPFPDLLASPFSCAYADVE